MRLIIVLTIYIPALVLWQTWCTVVLSSCRELNKFFWLQLIIMKVLSNRFTNNQIKMQVGYERIMN